MPRRCVALLLAVVLCAAFPAVTLAAWGPCATAPAASAPDTCCCADMGRSCEGCGCAATPGTPDAPATPAVPADTPAAVAAHDGFLAVAAGSACGTPALPAPPAPAAPSPSAIASDAAPLFLSVRCLRR